MYLQSVLTALSYFSKQNTVFFLVLPIFYFFSWSFDKSSSGKEVHPPSRVNFQLNFDDDLYEKNVDPFARAKAVNSSNSKAKEATHTGKAILYFPDTTHLFKEDRQQIVVARNI